MKSAQIVKYKCVSPTDGRSREIMNTRIRTDAITPTETPVL